KSPRVGRLFLIFGLLYSSHPMVVDLNRPAPRKTVKNFLISQKPIFGWIINSPIGGFPFRCAVTERRIFKDF
ncbi:hypothetical protein, partial [Turicimonas muris]|uniref:hypothetical protein n=1 Tax=Turicimonas muris TaxID=1796652 RepID=UPI0023F0BFCE